MPVPDWTKSADWDFLQLGGKRIPGTAHVHVSMPSGLDVKKPKGGRRGTIADQGTPQAEVKVDIDLLPKDVPAFEEVIPFLRPRSKGGARDPLDIAHPNTRVWGVNVVTVGPIESPSPSPGGTWRVSFTAYEWAPAPTKVKKPKEKPHDGDWNVQPLIDALRPARNGAAAENF